MKNLAQELEKAVGGLDKVEIAMGLIIFPTNQTQKRSSYAQ